MRHTNFSSKKFFGIETAFRHRDGKSAFGAIVCTPHQTFADQIAHSSLDVDLKVKLDPRRRAFFAPVTYFQKLRAADLASNSANEENYVAFVFEPLTSDE